MREKEPNFFSYKGRPLVRKDNQIYYGDMRNDYVVMMNIKTTKDFMDLKLPDLISVQLCATNPVEMQKKGLKVIKNKSEKNGFYSAIELASIWLDRETNE